MSNNPIHRYKNTSVTTAGRGQLLIMLYEAAIRNLRKAQICIEKKDLSGKGTAIGKTHDIINELSNSLNFDVGGDLPKQLDSLYRFMSEQLIQANVENSVDTLKKIEKILENLLSGWREAVKQAAKETSSAPTKTETNGNQ